MVGNADAAGLGYRLGVLVGKDRAPDAGRAAAAERAFAIDAGEHVLEHGIEEDRLEVLRRRARLTQQQFAARLGVPVETIRNWEQGKRMPRGPARALLAVIAHAPDTVFSALAKT